MGPLELDIISSSLITALPSRPWPILLCLFNRRFDKKRKHPVSA